MLNINLFRKEKGGNPDLIRRSQKNRGASVEIVDEIIELDQERNKLIFEINKNNQIVNDIKKKILEKIKANESYDDLLIQKNQLHDYAKDNNLELKCLHLDQIIHEKLSLVGNIVHESVIISMDEIFNGIVRNFTSQLLPAKYNFKLKSHYEIMLALDIIDKKRGANIAGHRGYFLKDYGVLLNQALINYGLNFLTKKQYTALQPPFLMRKTVMSETAQLEQFDDELYKVSGQPNDEEMYLIATSEQPLSAYHRGDVLNKNQLPLRYAGLSTCFRKEAGAHGKDVTGIFRTHQFDKVEQFILTNPDQSWEVLEQMITNSEEFYQSLKLPYQVINIVSGALNNAAAKKYDLEAWFPKYGNYRELVSASNCTDYQSRALNIRYGARDKDGQVKYVHMLNATLCATQRTLCCILENYQTDEGIVVPEVLRKYLDGQEFIPYMK